MDEKVLTNLHESEEDTKTEVQAQTEKDELLSKMQRHAGIEWEETTVDTENWVPQTDTLRQPEIRDSLLKVNRDPSNYIVAIRDRTSRTVSLSSDVLDVSTNWETENIVIACSLPPEASYQRIRGGGPLLTSDQDLLKSIVVIQDRNSGLDIFSSGSSKFSIELNTKLEIKIPFLKSFSGPGGSHGGIIGNEPPDTVPSSPGNEIFIVHGRDDGTKETVARFVEQLGLKVTILHEQPNEGRTIIEKLEDCANRAGFAIVLLTPDDVGALKDRIEDESKPRARQNVTFELGYFMGKLGRKRVCPLFKGEIENPSDIDGVVYVPMNDTDGWKLKLCQEMKNAGFLIDLNKLA